MEKMSFQVLRLVCVSGGCSSSTTGFLAKDCTSGGVSAPLSAVGRATPWPKLLLLANDSAVLRGDAFALPLTAPQGTTLRLCLDTDGAGPMPAGDAHGVYTGVKELLTHGVPQGLAEVIALACHVGGGCQDLRMICNSISAKYSIWTIMDYTVYFS